MMMLKRIRDDGEKQKSIPTNKNTPSANEQHLLPSSSSSRKKF